MAWHFKIVRGRFVFEDTTCEVKCRTMARTQEAARPVIRQGRLSARLKFGAWRAAQMRADANGHQDFRLDGSGFVTRIFRRKFVGIAFGFWISHLSVGLFQGRHHFWCALDYPHRLATPLNRLHFAGFEIGNIHLNRCTSGFRALGWLKCGDKRASGSKASDATCSGSCNQQAAPARVDLIFVTHNSIPIREMQTRLEIPETLYYSGAHSAFVEGGKSPRAKRANMRCGEISF